MGYRLPSYDPDACCPGTHCHLSKPEEPCWGPVEVAGEESWGDDEWGWVHACRGHYDRVSGDYGRPYEPSTEAGDYGPDGKPLVREDDE